MKNTLETRLGLFFALALVVAVIILEMIGTADFFKSGYQIGASFRNVQELKKGDLVKMAGVEIGRVEEIRLENGRARVRMKIKGNQQIKTDAKAAVKFTGLMGQNFVSIEGGSPEAPSALPGSTLESTEQPDLSVIMSKLENVATGIEGLTKSFSPEGFGNLLGPLTDFLRQNQGNLTAMIGNMKVVSDNLVTGKGTVGRLINEDALYVSALNTVSNFQSASTELKGVMNDAQALVNQTRGIVTDIQNGQGTIGRFVKDDTFYRQSTNAMGNLGEILQKINTGQGSVGKLVNDDTLYRNAKLGLQKIEKATEGLEDQGPLSVLGMAVNSLF